VRAAGLVDALWRSPHASRIEVSESSGEKRHYHRLKDRQAAHISEAIPRAREAGLTHLLHASGGRRRKRLAREAGRRLFTALLL